MFKSGKTITISSPLNNSCSINICRKKKNSDQFFVVIRHLSLCLSPLLGQQQPDIHLVVIKGMDFKQQSAKKFYFNPYTITSATACFYRGWKRKKMIKQQKEQRHHGFVFYRVREIKTVITTCVDSVKNTMICHPIIMGPIHDRKMLLRIR